MENFMEIKDLSDPRLDPYARLTEAQLAQTPGPKSGLFIAESPNVIARALDAGCKPVSILVEKSLLKGPTLEIIEKCGDIPVFVGENALLANLTGYKLTRGLLCAMERPAPCDAPEILQNAKRIAVLEDVVNPTNLGAIFRSAAALGMDAVLLTTGCSDPMYRRAARVSMGTVFQIPWAWWDMPIAFLKELGFATAAMALSDNSVSIDDPALKTHEKLAVVLGTEGEGLQDSTIRSCDYTVKIPMYHGVDSLNVAAASAVAFYALRA
ncbi:MAG: RNA methyltransferase [Oscillospiraceae bacterium]|nr:RNA methyltransferase [Oscillospiraceae bacterium]